MSFTVNSDAENELIKRGWEVIEEHKENSTWIAIKRIEYGGDIYKTMVSNNIVIRDGDFVEEFIITFTIYDYYREVEIRCFYTKLTDLIIDIDNIVNQISKFEKGITNIP